MVEEIRTIYVKELNNINEVFKENSKLPDFLKKGILFLKKIFCVVTIKENGICVLPYREIKRFSKIKLALLQKVFLRIDLPIVLSNYLEGIEGLKKALISSKLALVEGNGIVNDLLPEVIQYLCKMLQEEPHKQEITILVENQTSHTVKIIMELANKVKRIQIVTPNIGQFTRLENELETNFGMACQITNNKRKSLSKSKIIINLDCQETFLNQFNINPYAIIIDMNRKTRIQSKAFCGIHIYDYQINVDQLEYEPIFEIKKQYEAKMLGKTYKEIRSAIKNENVRIINLIGKKGIICRDEYKRVIEMDNVKI